MSDFTCKRVHNCARMVVQVSYKDQEESDRQV